MNEILIILITFCSILLLFIGGRILIKKSSNLIEEVLEVEEGMLEREVYG